MLKEAKKWVQTLEETLTNLSKEFNKSVEELDDAFTEWYDNGGSDLTWVARCPHPKRSRRSTAPTARRKPRVRPTTRSTRNARVRC